MLGGPRRDVCTQGRWEGKSRCRVFSASAFWLFFSQGWLLTRLNSIYCTQLLKEVSWSTDNP